jgi:retron-type reverse transcriptase
MNPPPFLVSFSTSDQFLKALPEDVLALYSRDFQELCAKRLPPVVSIRCLATLFGYSSKFTGALYQRTEKYYRTFSIPKGKKRRTIHAPRVALKVIQKWFGFHLAEAVNFGDCVFGFVKGRSAVAAAARHCGADWVYSVDIADFFPSTPVRKVTEAVAALGYPPHGAELISKLCCYGGGLSQGSPASPVLSNLVFRGADAQLVAIAQEHSLRYTRYADDVVFSGTGEFPAGIKPAVRSVIESHGWKLAENKERLSKRPNRLKVHGLLVHGEKPRLTKGYRNRIRAFKHLLAKDAVEPDDVPKMKGHLSYAQSVENRD